MSSAVSNLVPRDPPFSTSSGFVRDVSRNALAAPAMSPFTNVIADGPMSSSSSPVDAGRADRESGQGVLVHLVLGIARAQRRPQAGQMGDGQAAVLRDEHRLGGAELRRDLVDDRDLVRSGSPAGVRHRLGHSFFSSGFTHSMHTSFSLPLVARSRWGWRTPRGATGSQSRFPGACTSAGGTSIHPPREGWDQRSSASNRYVRRATLAAPAPKSHGRQALQIKAKNQTMSGRRRAVSTWTPGPIVDDTVIFFM